MGIPARTPFLAFALLLVVSACTGVRTTVPPGQKPPIVWCQGTLRNAKGEPEWTPYGKYLVELLPDGSVRAAGGGRVAGFPARGALSLVVKRDTDIHLGSIDGPVVGTASAGFYLHLSKLGKEVVELSLSEETIAVPPAALFVRAADLGIDAPAGVHTPAGDAPSDPMEPAVRHLRASLHSAPGGPVFARSDCDSSLHLVDDAGDPETGRRWLRVRFVERSSYDGSPAITFHAWIDESAFEAKVDCAPVVVELSSSDDIERARRLLPPVFAERSRPELPPVFEGHTMFWLTGFSPAPACVEVRRRHDRLEITDRAGDVLYKTSYDYKSTPDQVYLSGPAVSVATGRESPQPVHGELSCRRAYAIVGGDPSGTLMLPDVEPTSLPWFLWAYRPRDAETWYHDAAACESAVNEHGAFTIRALGATPFEAPGRLHEACL